MVLGLSTGAKEETSNELKGMMWLLEAASRL
jgi:hypothetical protein